MSADASILPNGNNLPQGVPAAPSSGLPSSGLPVEPTSRLDEWVERLSERLNPILVKEARQALKSNQFVITFLLLLVFGWGWSMLGVSLEMPDIRYAPSGLYMLTGYFLILLLPMIVIVPFSAFRSLATEREDGTFELMSITALSARQIVTGKLGSALLQMMIYFSALSPCIAFTYLLRGIDILIIVFILAVTLMISVLLTTIGLLIATVSRSRHWQTLVSVVLILSLFVAAWLWALFVLEAILEERSGMPVDDLDFWLGCINGITLAVALAVLIVQATAAQITFASDNASTPLRIGMFGNQLLFAGWMGYWLAKYRDVDVLVALMMVSTIFWALMGGLMVGESARLSPRVRRSLPQSLLGRMLFSLFNPGSATGYLFAVTNLAAIVACTLVAGTIAQAYGLHAWRSPWNWLWVGLLGWSYVAIYSGITRLIVRRASRFMPISPPLALLTKVVLLAFGILVPLIGEASVVGFHSMGYSAIQMSNWAWTIAEATDRNIASHPTVLFGVPAFALLILAINVIGSRYEVDQVSGE